MGTYEEPEYILTMHLTTEGRRSNGFIGLARFSARTNTARGPWSAHVVGAGLGKDFLPRQKPATFSLD